MIESRYKCPHCGIVFEEEGESTGREKQCPSCGKMFRQEPTGTVSNILHGGILWYFGVFKKYATFSGRARRRELWWAFLFQILAMSVIVVLFVLTLNNTANAEKAIYNLMGIVNLATALPMLAVQARRLHDTNKSAWWVLLQFLPVVNIVYFVWLATDGDRGENRFGQDPKEESRRHLS